MSLKNQSNDTVLQPKNIIQEKDEVKLLYLDDVRKNFVFLYQFSGVVASMRAFNFPEKEIVRVLNDLCAVDFEYLMPITLEGVCELGIFELASMMLTFLDSGQKKLLSRVLDNQYFCPEVLSVFYELSKIPIEEKLDAEKKRADFEAGRARPFMRGRRPGAFSQVKKYIVNIVSNDSIAKSAKELWKVLVAAVGKDADQEKCPLYADNDRLFESAVVGKEYTFKRFQNHLTEVRKVKNKNPD